VEQNRGDIVLKLQY